MATRSVTSLPKSLPTSSRLSRHPPLRLPARGAGRCRRITPRPESSYCWTFRACLLRPAHERWGADACSAWRLSLSPLDARRLHQPRRKTRHCRLARNGPTRPWRRDSIGPPPWRPSHSCSSTGGTLANPGFNASIDHIRDQLTKSGFQSIVSTSAPFIRVDEFPKGLAGWDYLTGTVWIEGDPVPVLSREQDRVSLAINSFSTSPGSGVTARLVDVGAGANDGDYAGKDVKGAVVLGDAAIGPPVAAGRALARRGRSRLHGDCRVHPPLGSGSDVGRAARTSCSGGPSPTTQN